MNLLTSTLIAAQLLAAVVWVGGMFFAYMALRPAAATLLDPPQRLPLWVGTFRNFFPWVWLAVVLLPVTGYVMIFRVFGGMAGAGLHIHLMQGIGWIMMLMFMHLYFAPFKRLQRAVTIGDWPDAAVRLAQIRRIVGINLMLGLSVTLIASAGRYL